MDLKMANKNFIQGAIKHPGALHEELGIPEGKTIPQAKLEKATHAGGKEGERARFAETLKGLHPKKKKIRSIGDLKDAAKKFSGDDE